jgi:putative transposase
MHAWVIMPNHVHLLFTPQVSVSKLLGALKAATAKRASLLLGRTGQPFWQDESFDHLIRHGGEFQRVQRYIERNPVTACLAARPEEYPWSSAEPPGRSGLRIRSGPPQAEGLPHREPQ